MNTTTTARAAPATATDSSGAIMHRARSFWFDSSDPYVPSAPLTDERRFDFCIVGGGIFGLSTAYHLKKLEPTASVALVESEVIGFGASGRNVGQLMVGFGGGGLPVLLKKYGAERMGAAYDYVARGLERLTELCNEERIDCDLATAGYIQVSLKILGDGAIDAYQKAVEVIGQDATYERLDAARVSSEFNSPHFGGGIYDTRGGQVNPLKLVRGLKVAAVRRGVEVFENTPVAHIETASSGVTVYSGAGSIQCGHVVLATNGYTHLLQGVPDLTRQQIPLMARASASEPISKEKWAAAGWPRRCGLTLLSPLFYSFVPTSDGRLAYLCSHYMTANPEESAAADIDWRIRRMSQQHLASFFPAFQGTRTVQTWAGPLSVTVNSVPHIGRANDPRILFACGCWGHGIPLGTQSGQTLAELALGRSSADTDLWFIHGKKPIWPPRPLTRFVIGNVIKRIRHANDKVAAAMQPPIAFVP